MVIGNNSSSKMRGWSPATGPEPNPATSHTRWVMAWAWNLNYQGTGGHETGNDVRHD